MNQLVKGIVIAALFFTLSHDGYAMPQMGMSGSGKSFADADINNDEKVTQEEFFAAFPNMREQAFTTIDANSDGHINEEEWGGFFTTHAADIKETSSDDATTDTPATMQQKTPAQKKSEDGVPALMQPE